VHSRCERLTQSIFVTARRSAAGSGWQVVGHDAEVDELACEDVELVDVGEVRGEAERDADGSAGRESERVDVVVERHPFAELSADERLAGDGEGDFAGARVAEAAGAEREVVPSGDAVDVALVDDTAVGWRKLKAIVAPRRSKSRGP
jgi:hypothetical protein